MKGEFRDTPIHLLTPGEWEYYDGEIITVHSVVYTSKNTCDIDYTYTGERDTVSTDTTATWHVRKHQFIIPEAITFTNDA